MQYQRMRYPPSSSSNIVVEPFLGQSVAPLTLRLPPVGNRPPHLTLPEGFNPEHSGTVWGSGFRQTSERTSLVGPVYRGVGRLVKQGRWIMTIVGVVGAVGILIAFVFAMSDENKTDEAAGTAATATENPTDRPAKVNGVDAKVNEVEIADFTFSPDMITVRRGSTVRFTNRDTLAHTATSDSDSGSTFDSGQLETGASYAHRFATNGTFTYKCAIHNSMTGSVMVS